MKLNLPAVLLILAGFIIVYAAQKDKDPRNVVFEALGIKRRVPNPPPVGAGRVVGEWHEPGTSVPVPNQTPRVVSV